MRRMAYRGGEASFFVSSRPDYSTFRMRLHCRASHDAIEFLEKLRTPTVGYRYVPGTVSDLWGGFCHSYVCGYISLAHIFADWHRGSREEGHSEFCALFDELIRDFAFTRLVGSEFSRVIHGEPLHISSRVFGGPLPSDYFEALDWLVAFDRWHPPEWHLLRRRAKPIAEWRGLFEAFLRLRPETQFVAA